MFSGRSDTAGGKMSSSSSCGIGVWGVEAGTVAREQVNSIGESKTAHKVSRAHTDAMSRTNRLPARVLLHG
jgi:hypothetical protein